MAARFRVPAGEPGPHHRARATELVVGGVLSLVAAVVGLVFVQPPTVVVVPSPPVPAPAASPAPAPTSVTTTMPPAPAVQAPTWTMPDLVGTNLQDAQDAIQTLTGYRIFVTSSHDATGAGREQVLDRNWKVCDQNVPAGTVISIDTVIDFGAVTLTESC